MLVLSGLSQDDPPTCTPPLPEPQAGGGEGGNVGGEEPGGRPGVASQSQVGEVFVRFLELSGVGKTMADGTDEESAHAARMDEWIV